jgi:hypothetical protein
MIKILGFLNTRTGSIIASALMGAGLATLFRKTCGEHCVMITAPDTEELRKNLYMIDGVCYKYTPRAVACASSAPA